MQNQYAMAILHGPAQLRLGNLLFQREDSFWVKLFHRYFPRVKQESVQTIIEKKRLIRFIVMAARQDKIEKKPWYFRVESSEKLVDGNVTFIGYIYESDEDVKNAKSRRAKVIYNVQIRKGWVYILPVSNPPTNGKTPVTHKNANGQKANPPMTARRQQIASQAKK